MNIKKIQKILKLRKLTKFSINLCKISLIKNNWNIDKAIIYLRNKEKKKLINNKNDNEYGIVYSKVNKKKTLGHIIKINVQSEIVSNNSILLNLLKNILKISLYYNCSNIKDILKKKNNNKITIENDLLDKSIMFKEKIYINKFYIINSDYIYNYNHHNGKLSSIVGFIIKDKKKKINKKIIKFISLDITGNELFNKKKNLKKINKYYNNKKIDILFLKRINLNINKYLYYLKNLIIYDYYIIKF